MKTYRDEEPYRLLNESCGLFNTARDKFDFKDIGKKNGIPDTVCALVMLSFRLGRLCESILSCGDYYTAAIIYRAMIEHSFKHIYLFMSCIKKGDDIAKEYSSDHISSELLQRYLKVLRPYTLKPNDKFKEFKKKSDKTSEKFKFSKILESILEALHEDEDKKMLRTGAVQYSALSSYVHAGPIAVLASEEISKKYFDIHSVHIAVIAYRDTIHLLSFYPSAYQDKLKALHKEMNKKADEALTICEKDFP